MYIPSGKSAANWRRTSKRSKRVLDPASYRLKPLGHGWQLLAMVVTSFDRHQEGWGTGNESTSVLEAT